MGDRRRPRALHPVSRPRPRPQSASRPGLGVSIPAARRCAGPLPADAHGRSGRGFAGPRAGGGDSIPLGAVQAGPRLRGGAGPLADGRVLIAIRRRGGRAAEACRLRRRVRRAGVGDRPGRPAGRAGHAAGRAGRRRIHARLGHGDAVAARSELGRDPVERLFPRPRVRPVLAGANLGGRADLGDGAVGGLAGLAGGGADRRRRAAAVRHAEWVLGCLARVGGVRGGRAAGEVLSEPGHGTSAVTPCTLLELRPSATGSEGLVGRRCGYRGRRAGGVRPRRRLPTGRPDDDAAGRAGDELSAGRRQSGKRGGRWISSSSTPTPGR